MKESVYSTPFVRGDVNGSGAVDIGDAIFLLEFLFRGGWPPGCLDSADVNDEGQLNITGAISVLQWLFSGGTQPAPPTPGTTVYDALADCGPDPTPEDGLDCLSFAPCPP